MDADTISTVKMYLDRYLDMKDGEGYEPDVGKYNKCK